MYSYKNYLRHFETGNSPSCGEFQGWEFLGCGTAAIHASRESSGTRGTSWGLCFYRLFCVGSQEDRVR